MSRVISWFSCGVTSAVATKLAINKYPDTIPVYCDTGSEHPDNARFLKDCEKWFGKEILILKSKKYKDTWEVFESGYLVGVHGAKCTTELKKLVRREFEQPDDLQIFGFDINEQKRAESFKSHNPEVSTWFPLIEDKLTKQDCLNIVLMQQIKLPPLYDLGFSHNNCIPCVKGGIKYFQMIKKLFPAEFERLGKIERRLGHSVLKDRRNGTKKPLYLDELDDSHKGRSKDMDIQCGLFCGEI